MGGINSQPDSVNTDEKKSQPVNKKDEIVNQIGNNRAKEIVKMGLLIGINYTGTDNQLNGCINDSENLCKFLQTKGYFKENDFIFMNDNKKDDLYPTRENICKQLNNLVNFANSEENKDKQVFLFLSYSGHGYYLEDCNGDEYDKKDEVLCPIDCNNNGYIRDDELKSQFIDKLPNNVKCFVLIDSCHSGSMLDLKYEYPVKSTNSGKKINLQCRVHPTAIDTECDVVMISGCHDFQTSADAYLNDNTNKNKWKYEYQGAMTASFIANFYDEITYEELISKIRVWLNNSNFDQVPQLSSGKNINLREPCLLSKFDN